MRPRRAGREPGGHRTVIKLLSMPPARTSAPGYAEQRRTLLIGAPCALASLLSSPGRLALALANLTFRQVRGIAVYRTLLIWPYAISPPVAGILFFMMFNATGGIFAALAEFERDLIRERTLAGLAAARARGRTGGRRFALTKAQVRLAQAAMANRETSVTELCRELGIKPVTLYRYVGPQGELRRHGKKVLEG